MVIVNVKDHKPCGGGRDRKREQILGEIEGLLGEAEERW